MLGICRLPIVTYSVSQKIIPPRGFLTFFRNGWEFFYSIFTHLLHFLMYARLQIFVQLSPTLTSYANSDVICSANLEFKLLVKCKNSLVGRT